MNLNYLIYKIFETKWKKQIFDEAIIELQQIPEFNKTIVDVSKLSESQNHYNKSIELMDLII